MKPSITQTILIAAVLAASPAAHAAVIVTLPTATTDGSIQFTNDITYTITTAGSVRSIIFDEWVTSDGSLSAISMTSQSLDYTLNGNSNTLAINALYDNYQNIANQVTPNDGLVLFASTPSVIAGDVFVVKAATYILPMGLPVGFNPAAGQIYSGNTFLVHSSGAQISSTVSAGAVPEPSSLGLLAVGGLVAFRRRRA